MPRFRVAVTDFIADGLEPEREVLASIADVVALDAKTEADLLPVIGDYDAFMAFHTIWWTNAALSKMTRCKLLVRCGVGYDNVDVATARKLGLDVANVPDYGTEEIADTAIGLTLALTRGINLFNNRLQRGLGPWTHAMGGEVLRLRGRTFGIVGCGRIGQAAALRAKALGMEVAFYDPYQSDGLDKALGIRRVETLVELLKQSHVVSPHCLLTAETRHIIGAKEIALMPRGSFLVNTSRGAVVDLTAISAAIESGHLAGAGIDVMEQEPPPADHPLIATWRDPSKLCHDRVILNPHAAFYSVEGLREMRSKGAESCRRALLGLPVRTVVNR